MLPYDKLVAMMPKLRFKDDTALRTIGLAQLAKKYDAYPVHETSGKYYYLLPKGAEIPTARKITPVTALNQIIVLQEGQKGFAKVWPTTESAKAAADYQVPAAPSAAAPQPAAKEDAKKSPELAGGTLEFVDE